MPDTSLALTRRNDAKHRATPEADTRPIYAGSATMSNGQKHSASDYEQRRSQVRVLPSALLKVLQKLPTPTPTWLTCFSVGLKLGSRSYGPEEPRKTHLGHPSFRGSFTKRPRR